MEKKPHNIRGILERHLSPTKPNDISKESNDERLEACILLDLLSNEMRTSVISSIVLRDICVKIQENTSTAKLFSSELVWESIENDLYDDNLSIVYSSVPSELDVYTELKEKFQGVDLILNSMGKSLYRVFINCEAKLWVDGCIFHGCNELLDISQGLFNLLILI